MLDPQRILEDMGIAGGAWADLGCGTGFFTIPLARRAEQVWAVDISDEMLSNLKVKLRHHNLNNVKCLLARGNTIPLCAGTLDGAFAGFVVHELDAPALFFTEVSRILRPSGRLLVVEFAQDRSLGPPLRHRVSPDQMDQWATATGMHRRRCWEWSRSLLGYKFVHLLGLEYVKGHEEPLASGGS